MGVRVTHLVMYCYDLDVSLKKKLLADDEDSFSNAKEEAAYDKYGGFAYSKQMSPDNFAYVYDGMGDTYLRIGLILDIAREYDGDGLSYVFSGIPEMTLPDELQAIVDLFPKVEPKLMVFTHFS